MPINPLIKVCIVTTAFPRWSGDSRAPFIFGAARAVKNKGAHVKVIAMHNPGAETYEVMDGIPVYRPRYLPEKWEVLQKESGGIPQAWTKNPLSGLALIPFLVVHIIAIIRQAIDIDIIHANWTISGAASIFTQWLHRKPTVITVQGSDIFNAPKIPLVKGITKYVLGRATQVLALSESLRIETIALGVPSELVRVIPNGVDTDLFQPGLPRREPLVLFVGSLIERKGPKYLIEAMNFLRLDWPEVKLVIIGEGSQFFELKNLVITLGLENTVDFVGAQTQESVSSWLRRAKVFVLPSIEEGLGVVLLEALSSATPCIGSSVGGIPDVITPDVGVLFPPCDSKKLADGIWELVHDPHKWQIYSDNARKRAETIYSWDKIGDEIIDVYQTAIGRRG